MEKSQCPSAGSKPEQREDPVTSQDFMYNVWDVYRECVCVYVYHVYVKLSMST